MADIKKISLIAMAAMTIVALGNLFDLNIAGISVIIGVVFFFIGNALDKSRTELTELGFKSIGKSLQDKKILFWVALPLIMNIVSIFLAILIFPEFIEHLYARTDVAVSFNLVIVLIIQLAILAIGEEIAWRAFFQNQLNKLMPILPTIIVTSIVFALGHMTAGNIHIVIYDILFIFINSVIYGVIFYKTKNVWVTAISHFIANLFAVAVILFML